MIFFFIFDDWTHLISLIVALETKLDIFTLYYLIKDLKTSFYNVFYDGLTLKHQAVPSIYTIKL